MQEVVDALICSKPGILELIKQPVGRPDPQAVLVRPRRVGICGTDYHIFEGKHPFLLYPRIMGHELAVEVVDAPVGSGLKSGSLYSVNPYIACGHCIACRAGKPNCCVSLSVLGVHRDGGMTGLMSLPAGNLIEAQGLTADECASVEFLAIGAHAVRRGTVVWGDRVLVVGAGPIGLGAALFARLSGGNVSVLDSSPERAAVAQSLIGVSAISSNGDPARAVADSTGGEGFNIVFDATGNERAMEKSFDYVCNGGRYVLVGVVKAPITFMDPDFHRKEMTLYASRNATSADFETVITAIRNKAVPIDRLITHRTTLAEAVRDIPLWATQKSGLIKAMIEVD
ncbi:MAG: zinc-binding alcohol dehydrogenase family protein [Hyphomicrobiales bacterium]